MIAPRAILVAAALGAACASAATAPFPRSTPTGAPAPLVIRDVTVWDATRPEGEPHATVVVRDGRIVEVGPADRVGVPDGARVVEGGSRWVIPGLWDLHVHALWAEGVPETFLPLFVVHGVTGVRDMGGTLEVLERARADLAAGRYRGPRLVAAGMILDGPVPVHPDVSRAIETPDQARAAVAEMAEAGADFVKVYTLLPTPAFETVVEAAAERGLPVAGHVPADVGPIAAARAGMVTIEHQMAELDGFCDSADAEACAPVFAAFREHGTRMVPALAVEREIPKASMAADPRLRYLPPAALEYWFDGAPPASTPADGPPGADPADGPAPPEKWTALAGALHRAGVPLLPGTDTGVPFSLPGWSLHEELELLVAAGMTPAEVLAAATAGAADVVGLDDLGTIEPGKRADLVLLRESPLEDVRNTRAIEAVVLDGVLYGRAALDGVLSDVEARARGTAPER